MENNNQSLKENISLWEYISYGFGDFGCSIVYYLVLSISTYYYTNVVGLSAALVGTIIVISSCLDGITDVLIGIIVDRTHSRFGKARAWILWMIVPFGVSLVLCYLVPENATYMMKAIYVFVTYNLAVTLVYTAINLPYGTLSTLMTRDRDQRADLNPQKFLSRGLRDIRDEIDARLQAESDETKIEFYQSAQMVMNALIRFIKRYAAAFSDAAADEKDVSRSAELKKIAETLAKVSEEKPATFFEAIQLLWILYIGFNMEACAGTTSAFARFDQYMNPFYENDISKGIMTREKALLYVCNLFAKINEPKMRVVIAMTIGGQRPDAGDAQRPARRRNDQQFDHPEPWKRREGADGIAELCDKD